MPMLSRATLTRSCRNTHVTPLIPRARMIVQEDQPTQAPHTSRKRVPAEPPSMVKTFLEKLRTLTNADELEHWTI